MQYQCNFCGFCSDNADDFELDFHNNAGYWCPYCDGFMYYETNNERHSFLLLLENPNTSATVENFRGSRHIPTRVSPLRYPGGKSKIIHKILSECNSMNMNCFVEPYAGGASVGLALLLSGEIKELYLNDIDYGIYSLFRCIQHSPDALCKRISGFVPSKEAYKNAQQIMFSDYKDCSLLDAAWALLVVNRLSFSGICKANCMGDPSARWNAQELIKRINKIHQYSGHIHISNRDALSFIEEMYWYPNATIFIDPPFFIKGKQLYKHFYQKSEHDQLAYLLDDLFKGMPGADMIVTYDMADYIRNLYEYPNVKVINRIYSIAN